MRIQRRPFRGSIWVHKTNYRAKWRQHSGRSRRRRKRKREQKRRRHDEGKRSVRASHIIGYYAFYLNSCHGRTTRRMCHMCHTVPSPRPTRLFSIGCKEKKSEEAKSKQANGVKKETEKGGTGISRNFPSSTKKKK